MGEKNEGKRKLSSGNDVEAESFDGSGLNYDMDGFTGNNKVEVTGKINGGNSSNIAISDVTSGGGEQEGKQKARAKHVLYRRCRNKFIEALNLLKSVVPNTNKKNTFSVIEGAVEYMKDLQPRIDNLINQLESTSPGYSLTPTTRLHPLTVDTHSTNTTQPYQ